jgi:hypothetical protein
LAKEIFKQKELEKQTELEEYYENQKIKIDNIMSIIRIIT